MNQEMMHVDVAIIGSGPAGHQAALQARRLNKSVALSNATGILEALAYTTVQFPPKRCGKQP